MSWGNSTANVSESHRGRRRNLFINPAFQWKYTSLVVAGVFVISAVMSFALYGMLYQQARIRYLHLSPPAGMENTWSIVLFAAVFAAIMAAGLGVWGVILTHRIGGPIHVMHGHLLTLARGRFPEIRPLRRKDEFKEFFEQFASTVEALKADREAELAALEQAIEQVKSAAESDTALSSRALADAAEQLERLREDLARSLNQWVDLEQEDCTARELATA